MARFTHKYMIEDYERLYAHANLLELYLYDTQSGAKPDVTERLPENGRIQLWRATGAAGGYVVLRQSTCNVWLLDDAIRLFNERQTEHTLPIRVALERLQIARNRLCRECVSVS